METRSIKDFLHLYLGCEVVGTGKKPGTKHYTLVGITHDNGYLFRTIPEGFSIDLGHDWKPILRPLSDMSEEEAADVYTIERDRMLHPPTNDHDISKRTDFGWVVTRLDHMNIGLLIRFDGVCYKVIDEGKRPTIEPAMNQPLIFQYLLSKGFDLFNLIPDGLAIDKTK